MRSADFYAEPRRASSEEIAFGATWRTQGEGPWRVVWVQATGELVAVQLGNGTAAPHASKTVQHWVER